VLDYNVSVGVVVGNRTTIACWVRLL